jgi:PAS domain S-box-containing protein
MAADLDDSVLRETLAIAVDAIICVDEHQKIIFFNDGAERIFGFGAPEVLEQPLEQLLPARFRGSHAGHVRKFGGSGDSARVMGQRGSITGLRKDGSEFPAEASIAHIDTKRGRVYSVVLRDITDRRRFEETNAQLVRELQSAVTARDEMMGIVSHDLRNPVNAVKMLAAAILRENDSRPLPAAVSEHADVMLQAAKQMDALIQDLLDVSRVESGKMTISPRVAAIDELVEQTYAMLRPGADATGVRLRADIPALLPEVDVDPERVIQVLSNLVGNAIKYSKDAGEVVVTAASEEDVVRISVADQGVGISDEELPRVFDRFWQSKRTNRSGAGLGLTIARGIVRAHAGRIWISSKQGEGTTVHFTLPRATLARRAEARYPTNDLLPVRVGEPGAGGASVAEDCARTRRHLRSRSP